ncbi:MAG: hypothetical protein P8J43_08530, partial [Pirellulales bacterium]|nr:hypothetical protein [Pirellulales bacterium]
VKKGSLGYNSMEGSPCGPNSEMFVSKLNNSALHTLRLSIFSIRKKEQPVGPYWNRRTVCFNSDTV